MKLKLIVYSFFLAIILISCKSTDKFESRDPESVFNKAVELFNKEDYLESRNLFEMIKLQYSATEWADDAQYYLGEIAYKRKEYVLAAFNYNQLRRSYPGSVYAKTSLFKTALSFYELSPKFDRDQEYTKKAIQAFQEFQYIYPDDSLSPEASKKISELRNKLAYRDFFTANLYRKLDSPHSALIYYNSVIKDYNDTEYYEPSFLGKVQVLLEMEKIDEAKSIIQLYKKNFPNGKYLKDIAELERTVFIK
ncbi:MAG: outer membrane protein assembly factor BamD [Bacteroidota bacterium]